MNNWKEEILNDGKGKNQFLLFDFFIDDLKFTTGELADPEKSELVNGVKEQVLSCINGANLSVKMEMKNFGKGADWSMALIEFLSKNDAINGLSNIGGLLGLIQIFGGLFKSLKKSNKSLRVGFKSAELLALGKVFKKSRSHKIEKLKIVLKKELTKNFFGFDEKYFLFVIRSTNRDFFVMVDWHGKIKIISKI